MPPPPGPFELLQNTDVEVHAGEFALISISREAGRRLQSESLALLACQEPFLILSDQYEVTLLLERTELSAISMHFAEARVENGFRLLTFTAPMDFTVVGFFAEASRLIAEAGVPILAMSAFSRDHILIKEEHLGKVMSALRPYVREIG